MNESKTNQYFRWGLLLIIFMLIAISGYCLTAWITGLAAGEALTNPFVVKPNMALGQFLSGLTFLILILPGKGSVKKITGFILAFLVLLIGLITLSEYFYKIIPGLDNFLYSASVSFNCRMGIPGAVSLSLLGTGFLNLIFNKNRAALIIALALLTINFVPIIGYLLGNNKLFSNYSITYIAFESASFMLLSAIGIIIFPHKHLKYTITRNTIGGILLRRLIPAVIILPVLLGFLLFHGHNSGLYELSNRIGALLVAIIFIFTAITFGIAKNLDRLDLIRKKGEENLRRSEKALQESNRRANDQLREIENLYRNIPIGLCVFDLDLRYIRINEKLAEINGLPAQEHIGKTIVEIFPSFSESVHSILNKIIETGEPQNNIELTGELPSNPGKIRSWKEDWIPIKNESGEIIAINVLVLETTEQKKAEEQLNRAYSQAEQSRMELKTILDNAPIAIWMAHDPLCHKITGNKYANERIMKVTPETNISANASYDDKAINYKVFKNGFELKPEEMPAQVSTSTGKPFETDTLELRFDDGRTIYLAEAAVPLLNDDGTIRGAVITGLDVTKQKEAEQELLKSEERLRTIAECAPAMIAISRLKDSEILFTNDFHNKAYGYVEKDFRGKLQDYYCHPEERDEIVRMFKQNGFVDNYRLEMKRMDGTTFWIITSIRPIIYNGEEAALSISVDITEYKNLENALIDTQNRLTLALEKGDIGIWEFNLISGKLVWNDIMEKMFGLQPGTFGKTRQAFEELIESEDIARINYAIRETIENDSSYEIVYRTKPIEGKIRYIKSKAVTIRNDLGNPEIIIGVSFDITSLRANTEKLIMDLNEELMRSNKELENFAYIASHDLQEPLRMVTSFTQLLQSRYKDKLDEDANTYIQYAVDGSKRMYDLLNGLLAYSRIKSKGHSFLKVDMNKVIEKVKENLSLRIDETKTVLKCADLGEVYADENQMIQLFQNLIENSIKFCKKTPLISISSVMQNGNVTFCVKDDGIGIEPQYFDRIFKIFQKLHTNTEYSGMGLGLAICQRIVERHKGKIWVESVPGKGSEFFFSIPKVTSPVLL